MMQAITKAVIKTDKVATCAGKEAKNPGLQFVQTLNDNFMNTENVMYSMKHPLMLEKCEASGGSQTHASRLLGKCPNH